MNLAQQLRNEVKEFNAKKDIDVKKHAKEIYPLAKGKCFAAAREGNYSLKYLLGYDGDGRKYNLKLAYALIDLFEKEDVHIEICKEDGVISLNISWKEDG